MEEKERYKYYAETNQLYDSEEDELYAYNLNNNKIISILNQQDKRIKELDKVNQDKISFAVEQLEKVKEYNDNLVCDEVCDDEDYYNYITAFIDNQINELKEGK